MVSNMTTLTKSYLITNTAVYFDSKFKQLIEDHIELICSDEHSSEITVSNVDAAVYHGDFNGLLLANGVEHNLHWIIMRMNGLTSPMQYTSDNTTIRLPDISYINILVNRFRANQTINKSGKK